MVHVIARMEIKAGCMEAFKKILDETVPQVLAEAGCIRYVPCVDVENAGESTMLTFVECWESEAHLQAHHQTPHMARFRELAAPLRGQADIYVMKPL